VYSLQFIAEFVVTVLAEVTAHYLCKWFDRDNNDSKPTR
jgi:uncharacterized protein YodC (DUF2158 family)